MFLSLLSPLLLLHLLLNPSAHHLHLENSHRPGLHFFRPDSRLHHLHSADLLPLKPVLSLHLLFLPLRLAPSGLSAVPPQLPVYLLLLKLMHPRHILVYTNSSAWPEPTDMTGAFSLLFSFFTPFLFVFLANLLILLSNY